MCKYLTGGIGSLASINDQTENLLIESRAKSLVPPGTWPEPSLWIGLSKAARGNIVFKCIFIIYVCLALIFCLL